MDAQNSAPLVSRPASVPLLSMHSRSGRASDSSTGGMAAQYACARLGPSNSAMMPSASTMDELRAQQGAWVGQAQATLGRSLLPAAATDATAHVCLHPSPCRKQQLKRRFDDVMQALALVAVLMQWPPAMMLAASCAAGALLGMSRERLASHSSPLSAGSCINGAVTPAAAAAALGVHDAAASSASSSSMPDA